MTNIKVILLFFALTLSFINVNAQAENKNVTITTSGSGKTQDEAKQSALRSAIEQAFGTFISAKTEILNDQLMAEQIVSVSNGNIQSFEILNESQLPDGTWGVTLKTIVSVDKLTSFVQAKGITIEIKGGMFAFNIKQQLLNEEGEIKAVEELIGLLHEPMQISFDYVIKSSEPKSIDAESKNWEIPLEVSATCNKNIDFCANYFIKTLTALSLSSSEVETYKSLNKQVYPVSVKYIGNATIPAYIGTFYLRKQTSIDAINVLLSNWEFYTRLFAVQSGMDESFGIGEKKLHKLSTGYRGDNEDYEATISFPTAGDVVGTFKWNDKRTLSQIEQMTGYTVKPRGVISNFKHGGYVVSEPFPGGYRIGLDYNENFEITILTDSFPAALAGLKIGDKIVNLNNTKLTNRQLFFDVLKTGEIIKMDLIRNNEKLTLNVKPIYLKPYKGLVVAIRDIGYLNWSDAKTACEELVLNGYSDWYLPSIEELQFIYMNFKKIGIFVLKNTHYWSRTDADDYGAFDCSYGQKHYDYKSSKNNIRAVREF
jgi:hypothetical protein